MFLSEFYHISSHNLWYLRHCLLNGIPDEEERLHETVDDYYHRKIRLSSYHQSWGGRQEVQSSFRSFQADSPERVGTSSSGKKHFLKKLSPHGMGWGMGDTWDSSTWDPWKTGMDDMGYGRHGRKTWETRISLNSHLLNDIGYCRLNHIVQMVLVTGKGSFAPNLKKWLAAIA